MEGAERQGALQVSGPSGKVVGVAELQELLVKAGAQAQHATLDWVGSHSALIAWRLALQERQVLDLQGCLLTSPVVLDQLMYRCCPAPVHHAISASPGIWRGCHACFGMASPCARVDACWPLPEPNACLLGCKRRYEREVHCKQRSTLKRVLEEELPSSKVMVLQVCSVLPPSAALGERIPLATASPTQHCRWSSVCMVDA